MIQISMFLVIDANVSVRSMAVDRDHYAYTNQGSIIYQFGVPVPIIKKGKGCIGLAVIEKIEMSADTTMAYFTVTEISDQAASAYYNLYRNTVSMGTDASSDIYENASEMIIPGIAGSMVTPTSSKKKRKSYGNNYRNGFGSLSNDFDDDDDDY